MHVSSSLKLTRDLPNRKNIGDQKKERRKSREMEDAYQQDEYSLGADSIDIEDQC